MSTKSLLLAFICLFFTKVVFSQNLYSGGSGNAIGAGAILWYTSDTRTGPTATPSATSILNIGNNHTVTFPNAGNATYAGIVVDDDGNGGVFQFGNGGSGTHLTITGNIVINSNGTFRSGGTGSTQNIFLQGNLINDNVFDMTIGATNQVVSFTGSTLGVNQVISGAGSFAFERLTMNTGSNVNVNVNSSISVSTIITFSADGLLILNSTSNMTLGTPQAFFSGSGTNRYIQVDDSNSDDGQIIKLNSGATTSWRLLFPIGTATGGYTPLDMSSATLTNNPTNNSSLAIKILYNQSVPGQLRRQFRLKVTGNAVNTTFHSARFNYNETTDVSTGDVLSSYSLIRYTNNSNVTSIINGTAPGASGFFTAPASTNVQSLQTGTSYFSIGSSAIWYTYQDGVWSNWEVWTQDPSGTTLLNPLTQLPLPGDQVVILNGYTVTSDVTNIALSSLTIEGGGILDVDNTTGHNLGTIDGTGLLRINGVALPGGTYTTFVSTAGGTIEYYNTSGTLPAGQTIYNHLLITNSTNANATFVSANSLTINGNLTITQTAGSGNVTWQINDGNATQRVITINGNLLVNAGGRIRAGTGAPAVNFAHTLTIFGNMTNQGSIKFFDDTDAFFTDVNYTNGTVNTQARKGNVVNVTFSGVNNQTLTCSNQTDFYRLIVNKGSGQQAILTVNSSATTNFRLFAPNNQDYGGSGTTITSNNALSIVNGTLELTGTISIPTLVVDAGAGIAGGWPIPQTGALWVNSANVTINATNTTDTGDNGRQIYVYGLLRLTNGTINMGYSRGLLGGGSGVFVIEGGTLNTFQIRTTYLGGGGNRFAYLQRGGVVNVGTTGTAGPSVNTYPRFALPYVECTFEMSGGTLNVATPMNSGTSNNGGILIFAASSNINVTGGTINAILPASNVNFNVCTTAPLYNLNVSKAGAGTSTFTLSGISFSDGTTYARAAQPLIILNDLTLITGNTPTFNCNNIDVSIAGNFNVQSGTTYTSGTNTLTFNGTSSQTWTNNGTINALNNIVINKTGTLQLDGANAMPSIVGLTLTSGTLNDGGKTLTVSSTLSNSAIHTGSGSVVANGPTTIGGSNGVFGNLTISTNSTVTLTGAQTVTGNLRLTAANASLSIGANNLSVQGNIFSDATTGVVFGATKRIITNGFRNDGGLTRTGSAGALLFPVGTATSAYSPVTINVTATTHGRITVRPVAIAHPNVTPSGQGLNYYWRVTSTGYAGVSAVSHNNFTFGSTGLLAGTLTAYKPARYDQASFTWSIGTTYNATGTTVIPNFSFGVNIDGEYTAGNITAGALLVFYSRQSGAWNNNTTWSNSPCTGPGACGAAVGVGVFPCANCPVVIGNDNNTHTVTIDANSRSCGSLMIHTNSTVDCGDFTGLNFGVNNGDAVTGRGTLRISANVFPAGDFSNFIGQEGGTVEWYGNTRTLTNVGPAPQNLTLNTYYNLVITPNAGNTITLPATNLLIYNNFTKSGQGSVTTNTGAARILSIQGNFNTTEGTFSTASGNTTDFIVNGNTTINSGAAFQPANTTARTHTFTTTGNIVNNGTLSFRSSTHLINLIINGQSDTRLTGTNAGASTTLNLVTIDKGTSQVPKFTLDVAGTITTLGTGWLTLTNGNMVFQKPSTTFTLQTAAATYSIPATARLTVQDGTVNVISANSNAADLLLTGTLEVNGGAVIIGSSANNAHNDIEYATAGSPTIIVSSGSLYVNGAIRRPTTSLSGALIYNQTGGTVTVGGRNAVNQNTRGVFEIENNAGSTFIQTGGTLTIERSAGNASSYADIYINSENSSVSSAGTVEIGLASGTVTTPLSINITPAIGNLTIVGNTAAQTVNMRSSSLTTNGTLTISTNTTLATNSLDVTIGENLVIDGTYNGTIGTGNTTTFNGSGAQSAKLSATSTFQNVTVNKPAGTITLSGVSPIINNLNILSGIFDVASLGLTVQGNIVNNSSQIGAGAIIMSGSAFIQYITSNNGTFTNLTLAGSGTSKNIKLTGDVSILGTLTFSSDNRYFSIGSNQLTFGPSAITTGANALSFIRTNGASSDVGVRKQFPLGNSSFTYEVGVLNYYTPVTLTLNATSAGDMFVTPVNQRHPTTNLGSTEQILNYYWMITRGSTINYTASGSHVYAFPSGLMSGSGGALVAGYLDLSNPVGWITSAHGGSATTSSMTYTNLLGTNLPTQDNVFHYTVGTINTLPNPIVPIYSRLDDSNVANTNVGGNWTSASSWTTSATGYGPALPGTPPLGIPVVILANSRINMNANARSALTTRVDGLLLIGTTGTPTLQHNLGTISGTGTIRTATNTFPAGNYNSFVSASGGTIEYVAPMTMNNRSTYNNLSFTGSGAVVMTNTDLTLNGSMTIGAGVTVSNANNRNISLLRNWNNSGTYSAGSGTVTFTGSNAQTVSGNTTLYNVTVNKGSGNVTLSGAGQLTITNNTTLTAGHIVASATHPLYLTNTAGITGGSANSFIVGRVIKAMNAGTSVNFPLGALPSRYRPTGISSTSDADVWTIQYFASNPGSAGYSNLTMNTANIRTVSEYEYWDIARSGAATAGVTLSYNSGSYSGDDVGPMANLRVARWNGSQWDVPPGGGVHSQSGSITAGSVAVTNVTSFSPFTLASTAAFAPLPVSWLSFDAERSGHAVVLKWKTAQERNSSHFEVERSPDGMSFAKVGQVSAAGNSNIVQVYEFTDESTFATERYYYRLKQVDLDKVFDYSKIIFVQAGLQSSKTRYDIYPNPVGVEEDLIIKPTEIPLSATIHISVLTTQNKLVFESSGSITEMTARLNQAKSGFAAGLYILVIRYGVDHTVYKVVVR